MKRASTRNVVLSKAMRYVDEETRNEFRDKRLQSLECDNYVENEVTQNDDEAYQESDEEGGGPKKKRTKGNQKPHTNVRTKWATKIIKPLERILLDNGIYPTSVISNNNDDNKEEEEVSYRKSNSSGNTRNKIAKKTGNNISFVSNSGNPTVNKSRIDIVNYRTVAAKPSIYPARHNFCSVCGYIASYTCTRCGSRYCSIKCNENHKETRCLKFSM